VAKKWIQKAIKKPGSLRRSLGIKKGKKIPKKKLIKAAKKKGKMGRRARLAITLGKMRRK
jgi:predicted choloylglycine hydrolase